MNRALLVVPVALIACKPDPYLCAADLAPEQNTLIELTVTAPADADAHVVFSGDGGAEMSTPDAAVVAGEPHVFDLFGIGPLVRTAWSVVVGGTEVCAGDTETRNLPTGLAQFRITNDHPELTSPEPYMFLAINGVNEGLILINRAGDIVWYRKSDGAQWVTPYWRGETALFNEFDAQHMRDEAMIRRVDARGTEIEAIRTVQAHHTFTELLDGTLTFLRRDLRTWHDPVTNTDEPVIGDAIVERALDGTETTLFDAWDSLEVHTTPDFYKPFYRDGHDWTHANAVNFDEERGTYLTSFSNLDTVLELGRDGVAVRWFGTDGIDPYGYIDGARTMNQPHDPKWTGPDTFTVYITDDQAGRSGVVEYQVDEEAHALREIWEFGFQPNQPSHKAYFLGQAFRLENGNELVKWAQTGRIAETTPDGTIVWDLRLNSGSLFGEMSLVPSLYGGVR